MIQRYSEFRPTSFDVPGLSLEDRQDWIVVPVSQTRDSGPFDQSNFAVALDILGGESETVEVHRFGHWGPGWFEIIIVDPARMADVEGIADSLEAYPVLSDDDFSEREFNEYVETWNQWGEREFRRGLEQARQLHQFQPKHPTLVRQKPRERLRLARGPGAGRAGKAGRSEGPAGSERSQRLRPCEGEDERLRIWHGGQESEEARQAPEGLFHDEASSSPCRRASATASSRVPTPRLRMMRCISCCDSGDSTNSTSAPASS